MSTIRRLQHQGAQAGRERVNPQESLLRAVTALTGYFLGDSSLQDALHHVSQLARETVADSVQVGITLLVNDQPGTYVFTDPELAEIDRAQYDTGDGPCLSAAHEGHTVVVGSTRSSTRFPDFCRVARYHGYLAVMSVPLATPQGLLGAMNYFARDEHAFKPNHVELGERFAEQASFMLVNVQAYWDARVLAENLQQAMMSRAVIEQAKGIIMHSMALDADAAFALLKDQSQRENVKLRDIAARVVAQASRGRRS